MDTIARCPGCDSGELVPRGTHAEDGVRYTLVACQGCSLEHWQPLSAPHATYYEGEHQAMYAAMHEGSRRAADDPRFARFLEEFGGRRGAKLLDVGCADGALMAAFRDLGNEVVGIDIDTRSLEAAHARRLEAHRATLDDVSEVLGSGRRFDFVTMFDVLEHLTTPRRALEAARDLLTDEGLVIGTVPNRHRLFANLVDADFPPHHFLRFDRACMGNILSRVGLVPTRVEVFQWGYAGTVLLNRALRWSKALRGNRRTDRAGSGANASRAVSPSAKKVVARVINSAAAKLGEPFERGLDRGFKLYFVARRAT